MIWQTFPYNMFGSALLGFTIFTFMVGASYFSSFGQQSCIVYISFDLERSSSSSSSLQRSKKLSFSQYPISNFFKVLVIIIAFLKFMHCINVNFSKVLDCKTPHKGLQASLICTHYEYLFHAIIPYLRTRRKIRFIVR